MPCGVTLLWFFAYVGTITRTVILDVRPAPARVMAASNMLGFRGYPWACCPLKDFRLINQLLGKVFGTKNERVIKALMPKVAAINALEPQIQKLSDAELRAKTDEFRAAHSGAAEPRRTRVVLNRSRPSGW